MSIVIFSLFSFHLLHLSSHDKDITLLIQGGQYRRVCERVDSLECLAAREKCCNLTLILALYAHAGVMCMQETPKYYDHLPFTIYYVAIKNTMCRKISGIFVLTLSTNCSLPKQNVDSERNLDKCF